jgi:Fe2+ transport system protein FeoA
MDGKMPKQISKSLTDVHERGTFIVESVSDQDALLLKRLRAHGITPGARVQVTGQSQDDIVLRSRNTSRSLHLSRDDSAAVQIRFAQ